MFSQIDFSTLQWLMMLGGTAVIGMSKAGIKGIDMLNVTLMALVFGGKASTGVVLPLLCLADIFAVFYYKRHVQWEHFWKLLPPMFVGVVLGVYIGKDVDERVFKKIMAVIIVLTVIIMLVLEKAKDLKVPKGYKFSTFMGLVAGVATMLGNLAGAFSNIYFLALRMSKNDFIGTAAWVFLVINLSKVPFQIFTWKNIDPSTLTVDLYLIPALIVGFFIGVKLVGKINEVLFRRMILALTFLGGILIFIN
jgi:uncharacterized protein